MSSNFNIEKVLVAPLDWGLGHATRCIPIIRALLKKGCRVWLAAEGSQALLLQTEFPGLEILPLEGYRVRYGQSRWTLPIVLVQQLPRILGIIKREQAWLERQLEQHHFDLVISDNRYGLSSPNTRCIFITHQLQIKAPFGWLEYLLQKINYGYIRNFSACWVPDVASEPNLAGILSHPPKKPSIPVAYLGLLSRFHPKTLPQKYDYCILVSGPEPQRSFLETALIKAFAAVEGSCLLIRGKPGNTEKIPVPGNIRVVSHLPGDELAIVLQESAFIICRSGYTSVMEILALRRKAILIPTPGQTEQEYLGGLLMRHRYCYTLPQNGIPALRQHLLLARSFDYQLPDLSLFSEDDPPSFFTKALSSNRSSNP